MTPVDYDAWYDTPRGRWIGEREYAVASRLLAPQRGDSLLDVGCGTGWFSRRFARDGWPVTGVDAEEQAINFARDKTAASGFVGSGERDCEKPRYLVADGRALPFADNSFDLVLSIAALCFIDDERKAVAELVRVVRRRFVIGWLNRSSLLFTRKGANDGSGAYRGARWHNDVEVKALLSGLPVENIAIRSAVFFPDAGLFARIAEPLIPAALPWGSMLFIAGDKRGFPGVMP